MRAPPRHDASDPRGSAGGRTGCAPRRNRARNPFHRARDQMARPRAEIGVRRTSAAGPDRSRVLSGGGPGTGTQTNTVVERGSHPRAMCRGRQGWPCSQYTPSAAGTRAGDRDWPGRRGDFRPQGYELGKASRRRAYGRYPDAPPLVGRIRSSLNAPRSACSRSFLLCPPCSSCRANFVPMHARAPRSEGEAAGDQFGGVLGTGADSKPATGVQELLVGAPFHRGRARAAPISTTDATGALRFAFDGAQAGEQLGHAVRPGRRSSTANGVVGRVCSGGRGTNGVAPRGGPRVLWAPRRAAADDAARGSRTMPCAARSRASRDVMRATASRTSALGAAAGEDGAGADAGRVVRSRLGRGPARPCPFVPRASARATSSAPA
jgi:hypothetical protein